jgi:PD-(D/E)XK endonuclease
MNALATDQKGQIAILKVQLAAARNGALVFLPSVPCRYDLVLDYNGTLYRAQVKYADCKAQNSEGAVRLDLRRRKRCYTRAEVDVLLVYIRQIDRVCWFGPEVFDETINLQLRMVPARNGQKRGCLMVEEFVW